jgi:hypothetical protein
MQFVFFWIVCGWFLFRWVFWVFVPTHVLFSHKANIPITTSGHSLVFVFVELRCPANLAEADWVADDV